MQSLASLPVQVKTPPFRAGTSSDSLPFLAVVNARKRLAVIVAGMAVTTTLGLDGLHRAAVTERPVRLAWRDTCPRNLCERNRSQ